MNIFQTDSLLVGLYTLRSNPLRTILSTLGVIIGVAALVAVLSLGDSLEAFSRRQIEQTTDLQSVTITPRTVDRINGVVVPRKSVQTLSRRDIADLQNEISNLGRATLALTGSAWTTVSPDSAERAILVVATLPGALAVSNDVIAVGRFLTSDDFDAPEPVAVLSHKAALLYGDKDTLQNLIGATLNTGENIVGILAKSDLARPPAVYVPIDERNVKQLSKPDRPAVAVLRANVLENVPEIVESVNTWLDRIYNDGKNDFVVTSSHQRVTQATQAMLVFKLALGSIAGISLLVGGIGIMNILLASVTERTREIGVRRATGARRGHILVQFLSESVIISIVGSLIGAALGIAATFLITFLIEIMTDAPIDAVFSGGSLLFAAAAAIVIGLTFGTYPARQAARIEPAAAMRYE